MLPEARLEIGLSVRAGRVADVRIASSRMVQASALFAGKRPDEATRLLPVLFALCGTAQVLAGLGALEQAAGLPPSAAQIPARHMLAQAEIVAEHGLAMARDWPLLAGAAPDMAAAKRIRTAMLSLRCALYPRGDWHRPGGGALHPDRPAIRAALFAAGEALDSLEAPAHILLEQLNTPELAAFGRGPFLPMPEDGPADLAARLEADYDGAYLARPDSAGRVFETGPLARQGDHPEVAAALGAFGPGLLARFTARLVEVRSALQEMAELVQHLNPAEAPSACLVDGAGLGLVEAARGLLAHRVELAAGRVTRYQILAPTEWNFHPDGPLVRGLRGAEAGPELERRAALLLHGLDPCVAATVKVDHA